MELVELHERPAPAGAATRDLGVGLPARAGLAGSAVRVERGTQEVVAEVPEVLRDFARERAEVLVLAVERLLGLPAPEVAPIDIAHVGVDVLRDVPEDLLHEQVRGFVPLLLDPRDRPDALLGDRPVLGAHGRVAAAHQVLHVELDQRLAGDGPGLDDHVLADRVLAGGVVVGRLEPAERLDERELAIDGLPGDLDDHTVAHLLVQRLEVGDRDLGEDLDGCVDDREEAPRSRLRRQRHDVVEDGLEQLLTRVGGTRGGKRGGEGIGVGGLRVAHGCFQF